MAAVQYGSPRPDAGAGAGRGGAGEMLAASFASLATGATAPWGLLALLAGAGVLGYLSIRLSVRFYARQEL